MILLAFAFFLQRTSRPDIPGWKPVNEALATAISGLASEEQKAKETTIASSSPRETKSPESSKPKTFEQQSSETPQTQSPSQMQTPEQPKPPEQTRQSASGLLDLNVATESQLDALPGIGPSKAKAIIAYREQHGGFRTVKDLLQVKGIGAKLFGKIADSIQVSERK